MFTPFLMVKENSHQPPFVPWLTTKSLCGWQIVQKLPRHIFSILPITTCISSPHFGNNSTLLLPPASTMAFGSQKIGNLCSCCNTDGFWLEKYPTPFLYPLASFKWTPNQKNINVYSFLPSNWLSSIITRLWRHRSCKQCYRSWKFVKVNIFYF